MMYCETGFPRHPWEIDFARTCKKVYFYTFFFDGRVIRHSDNEAGKKWINELQGDLS